MHRYFVQNKNVDTFKIEEENFHHLKNVVKLKIGKQIVCIFENTSYLCEINSFFENFCEVKIIKTISEQKLQSEVTLILGIIREQKWDFILQKATELGATRIVPVEFKRNVVKIDVKKEDIKINRWLKICTDASEQSYRNNIPEITPIVRDLKELENYKSYINLTAYEEEKKSLLKEKLSNDFFSISIVVGPEGGLEKNEVKKLSEMGFDSVSLGQRILRAETVPLMFMSIINYIKE